jgi:hypothetical protein
VPGVIASTAWQVWSLWRVKTDLGLPVLELLSDGSYTSVVARPTLRDKAQNKLIAAASAGEHLDKSRAMRVRVIEYEIPGRDSDGSGGLIAPITTITDPASASTQDWPRPIASGGRRQDRHLPRGALPENRPPPGRWPGLPPDQAERSLTADMADVTSPRNLNPARRHRSYPRLDRRARLNSARMPSRTGSFTPRPARSW